MSYVIIYLIDNFYLFLGGFMEQNNFYAADFHVHTPSSNCYKGKKNNEEYINILERYVNENIKVIAITDHNSIDGYIKLMSLKNDLQNKLSLLISIESEYNITVNEISSIKEQLDLFNKITIFPGVEIEVNPGIHILLIFDNAYPTENIENLLVKCGYDDTNRGTETPSPIFTDVLNLYKLLEFEDVIVIAAHADSNKGIYNSIKPGTYRSEIFKSEKLNGISYNSEETKAKIESMLKQKEYARKAPLAFIKSSDFHGEDQCTFDRVYLDLEDFSFNSIKQAFHSPEQKISIFPNPEIESILNSTKNGEYTVCFPSIDDALLYDFQKAVCAIFNNGFGRIIIGITNDSYKNNIGTTCSEEEVKEYLKKVLKNIDLRKSTFKLEIKKYPFTAKSFFILNFYAEKNNFAFLKENNKIFDFQNNIIEEASYHNIMSKFEVNINNITREFIAKNNDSINNLLTEVRLLTNINTAFDLIERLNIKSLPLSAILKVSPQSFKDNIKTENKSQPGLSTTQSKHFLIINQPPRYNDSYLRFTPNIDRCTNADEISLERHNGDCILITPKGASYFINDDEYLIINPIRSEPILKLTIDTTIKDNSMNGYFIIGWLKSSLSLFYYYCMFREFSIYKPSVFSKAAIPFIDNQCCFNEIVNVVKDIVERELQFLRDINGLGCEMKCSCCSKNDSDDCIHSKMLELTNDFNKNIMASMYNLDQLFYKFFNVSDDHVDIINDLLKANDFIYFLENSLD